MLLSFDICLMAIYYHLCKEMGSMQVMLHSNYEVPENYLLIFSHYSLLMKKACNRKSRQFGDKHMLYYVKWRA